jgi:hypothetical protein
VYKAAHGDCSVPQQWAEDPGLDQWVKDQRKCKKKLDCGEPGRGMTVERAARLAALGFVWQASNVDDTGWEVQLARLAAYKAAHGDCNAPSRWAEDPRLASWVSMQRQLKKKLDRGEYGEGMTAERVAKLEALGFVWEVSTAKKGRLSKAETAARDLELTEFGFVLDGDVKTACPKCGWSANLREKGKMALHMPKCEESPGKRATTSTLRYQQAAQRDSWSKWQAQLARLAAYKAAHGDCKVPKQWAEDPRLGRWVHNQRKCKKKLDRGEPGRGMTVERAARLTALGFAWEVVEPAWEAQLARLAAYKAAHGDCKVPWGWTEDPRLSVWVVMQRVRKKKLDRGEPSHGVTAERAARLTALGFVWQAANVDDTGWEVQLARLAAYKAAHGDCSVPSRWADDQQLASWVNNQRARKKKLDRGESSPGITAERAAKLTALGFWSQRG